MSPSPAMSASSPAAPSRPTTRRGEIARTGTARPRAARAPARTPRCRRRARRGRAAPCRRSGRDRSPASRRSRGSRDDDGAARAGEADRLAERGRRLGGDVDDDVGETARSRRAARAPDRSSSTSTARSAPNSRAAASRGASRAPRPVTITKPAPACFAAAHAEMPRTPGPSTATTSPGRVCGTVTAQRMPAPSGLNIVACTGSSDGGTRTQQRVGREVLVLGVAAPQSGRAVDGHDAVHVGETVARAAPVLARPARRALAARQEHLDRDAIAGLHTPTRGRARADLLDDADRLVTGHERVAREQLAGELLVVGAAQAARLDAQERVVVADLGTRECTLGQPARCLQHQRARGGGAAQALRR